MPVKHFDLSIYLVTDTAQCQKAGRTVAQTVQEAIEGGVTTVQIREKDSTAREFFQTVMNVAKIIPPHVYLLVNDRVDVYLAAKVAGAKVDGVHIGQSELEPHLVRQLVGEQALIGQSAATPETLKLAEQSGVIDYVGIGALKATTSKRDAPTAKGLEELTRLRHLTSLPAVAIGGIVAEDLAGLRAANFDGAAVISAICASGDVKQATKQLADAWHSATLKK